MIWFFIAIVFKVLGVVLIVKDIDDDLKVFLGAISLCLGVLILLFTAGIYVQYVNLHESVKIADINLQNKRESLNEMKLTYYAQPDSKVNIDLVNEKLSISVNKSIDEFVSLTNEYNSDIVKLKTAKKLWFFVPFFEDISDLKLITYK
jgi:hypothetical protein